MIRQFTPNWFAATMGTGILALAFPLGIYTFTTLKLGTLLGIGAFTVFGTTLFVVLGAMWTFVAALTIRGGWKGHLFVSPCIATAS